MKPACLIIDLMHESIIPMLEEIGMSVTYRPEISASEVKSALKGFQVLIVRSKLKVTEDLIADASDLKIVARAGAGVDNIEEEALNKRNITLVNAPEGNREAVGEFTLGLLLALLRKIPQANNEVKARNWLREENRGEELAGKTIGIIGYGNMGKAFARTLTGFNCTVLAYDKAGDRTYDQYAKASSPEEIFAKTDIVSFHIPFTAQNRYFADAAFFERFQKPVWVINTARGEVMDYNALVEGLKAGTIKGAALDVLENEKLDTLTPKQTLNYEYLSTAPNVILTPHIAGWSHQSYFKINQILVQKVQAVLFQNDTLRH